MQRKSSRGNIWHDHLGRFCSGPEDMKKRAAEKREQKEDLERAIKESETSLAEKGCLTEEERKQLGHRDLTESEIRRLEENGETYVKPSDEQVLWDAKQHRLRRIQEGLDYYEKGATKSERTQEEYDERTRQRLEESQESRQEPYRAFYSGKDGSYYKDYPSKEEMEKDKAEETRKGNNYISSEPLKVNEQEKADAVKESNAQHRYLEIHREIDSAIEGRTAMPVYESDEDTLMKHEILKKKFGDTPTRARQRASERFSTTLDNGETISMTGAVKHVDGRGNIFYTAKAEDGYERDLTSKQYEARSIHKEMPWETDERFKGHKNAQLLWLMANPDSKFNNVGFQQGIKQIERMSDRGISAHERNALFDRICRENDISREEGLHFIQPEFLK